MYCQVTYSNFSLGFVDLVEYWPAQHSLCMVLAINFSRGRACMVPPAGSRTQSNNIVALIQHKVKRTASEGVQTNTHPQAENLGNGVTQQCVHQRLFHPPPASGRVPQAPVFSHTVTDSCSFDRRPVPATLLTGPGLFESCLITF